MNKRTIKTINEILAGDVTWESVRELALHDPLIHAMYQLVEYSHVRRETAMLHTILTLLISKENIAEDLALSRHCSYGCDEHPVYGFVPEADCPIHDK